MIKSFIKYVSIGVINTSIHWLLFAILMYQFNTTQATSNLVGFCAAVTFSFYANAKITFQKKATRKRYITFVSFMGLLSYITGFLSDVMNIYPIVTLIVSSVISLILGFMYSKFFVFKGKK
ncbi:GtrA family protein [Xenorhabdus bovienii]|uniref:Bactoprenol-linked glucose translocase n=1 Tax=Xenorhabdus bovienii str. kraussei Becker Underwood TaxID=1398204 RepID=A0A077PYD1_XENBV|nr:GtrA family protein [Xenorhabdus bovienii]CDH25637.1 bactoprenol-linked glucose translocase (flippase); CPS-53 (KpLE1) prophage [Xenorhabdus bovienii str. kraussei Becker Underwood]